jgi:type VI secretion system protein ImpL
MAKRLLAFLTSRWFISLSGASALAALAWFIGPLIGLGEVRPLEDETPRLVIVFAILLIWALAMQWSLLSRRAANVRMVEALAGLNAGPSPAAALAEANDEESAQELALLRERLGEAAGALKRIRFKDGAALWGGRYLYQLPWFMILGAPGAGKTTALLNSGLKFPLSGSVGRAPLRDLGGTRNCDWWFTDDAVLIDTAGRYATQDSARAVDSQVWLGFLDLLKRHRARQPINGALLTVSVSDLIVWSDAERAEHAHALKQRVKELREQLGVRFPIYLLLTKTDLLPGFAEFFEDLTREEREQVWGVTFPLDRGAGDPPALDGLAPGFDQLVERLSRRAADRLHVEPDAARRGLSYGFPAQLAALKAPLCDLAEIIFSPNRFEERALLRGVYFTSGAQDGSPCDALAGPFARAFALDPPQQQPAPPGRRSYFLTRLLREVVFQEANLAGVDHARERRRRAVYWGATGATAAVGLALAGFWLISAAQNRALLTEADAASDKLKTALAPLNTPPAALTRVNDTNFAAIVPFLDALRAYPGGWDAREQDPPLLLTGGLYQGRRPGNLAQSTYLTALRTVLLSRLFLRLEEQVRRERVRTDYLYQALKAYLMLGGKGPMDGAFVVEWMSLDWLSTLPGAENAATRASLAAHLTTLTEQKFAALPLDDGLVTEARATLRRHSNAEQGFDRLQQVEAVKNAAPWRISEKAGPLAARALVRPSGKALSDGVPGLYTYDGFHNAALPAVSDVAKDITAEGWVLGQATEGPAALAARQKLEKDILTLYLNEYARIWDETLADATLVPFRSLNHAADVLNAVSGPESPLKLMLTAAAKEVTLVPAPGASAAPTATSAASGPGAGTVNAIQNAQRNATLAQKNLSSLAKMAGVDVGQSGPAPGQTINDRFKPLRDYTASANGAPSRLDDAIKQLAELYQQVSKAATAPDQNAALLSGLSGGNGGDRGQLIAQIKAAAAGMPAPLGAVAAAAAQNAASVAVGGARHQINQAWTSAVAPLCVAALEGRFPMVTSSQIDVAPADFNKLFAPNGLIDQFFNTNLKPFVDQTRSPWKWQRVDGVDLGISQAALDQFERAARIRDGLFPSGATAPKVVFEVTPMELDARATQVILDVDGQSQTYRHGPPLPQIMRWPGGDGPSTVRLSFGPPLTGQPAALVKTGTWSLFRFLAAGTLSKTAQPERFTFKIAVGDRSVSYAIRADSINNPFGQNLMEAFRCPAAL